MKEHPTIKQSLLKPGHLELVRDFIRRGRYLTRHAVALAVCGHFKMRDRRGKPQTAQCVKVLRELESRGRLQLPPPASRSGGRGRGMKRLGKPVPAAAGVPARVDQIGELELVEVAGENEGLMAIWNELMIRDHPLGRRKMVGRQVRYLIRSEHGWLGGFGFGAPALKLAERERWIGWDAATKSANLEQVAGMNRFLIRSGVRCENLASRCLAMVAQRLPKDFERRYGYRPLLLESFVDPARYAGTCYRAANWVWIGKTKGRGRNDRHTQRAEGVKDIYVYPLAGGYREKLGGRPEASQAPGGIAAEAGLGDEGWAAQEFGGARLGDQRLTKRLVKVAGDRGRNPGQPYGAAAGGHWSTVKAYYNLVRNPAPEVTFANILAPHRERTIQRVKACREVCVIQDTTDLNYGTLKKTRGLGVIGKNVTNVAVKGLKLHTDLAVAMAGGVPLGILGAACWAPGVGKATKAHRNCTPIEEKDSFRWVAHYREIVKISRGLKGVQVVCVMDREADIWEVFQEALTGGNRVGVVVRAQHNRCLAGGGPAKLFGKIRAGENRFEVDIQIPRQREREGKPGLAARPGLPPRTGRLRLTYEQVSLQAPLTALKKGLPPLTVWAVGAWEEHPPAGAEPIEWKLLTTVPVTQPEEALKVMRYYSCRWRIEDWHRVLKSGCKVEDYQNSDAHGLKNRLAIDMVLAWRILLLTLLGREIPNWPCSVFFSEWEWKTLVLSQKKPWRTD